VPLSINVPLPEALPVIYVKEPGVQETSKCPGLSPAGVPEAKKGFFCLYRLQETGGFTVSGERPDKVESGKAGPSGVLLLLISSGAGAIKGTWAVTAE
jgi:hypothetical protein